MADSPKYNCGCRTGKSCFQSKALALGEINRFKRHRKMKKRDGYFLSAYQCNVGKCRCFHVGNTSKNRAREQ